MAANVYSSALTGRPLWRTAWRRILRRPFQYLLLILGVALGVAMMVSVDLANGSASRAFALSTDAVVGRTTHRLVGGPAGLDEDVYRRLRTEVGFSPAAPVVEGYVLVPELGNQPLRLVGVDPFAEPPFRDYFGDAQAGSLEGLVSFLTEPNAVLLSLELARRHGVELGDSLTLDRAGRKSAARIVGLLDPADGASARALETLIFTDVATGQELLEMAGRLSHVDLIADDDEALAPLAGSLPPDVRLEPARARSNTLQQMASAFQLNLTSLSLLALVVGMFLIYNTVTFSVIQRRRLFGILRALGVTGGQLFGLILAEAAILGLIGAALGLGVGVLLGRGMVGLVSQTINDFYFVVNVRDVTVPGWTLVKGLVVGVAAAVAASAVPAWEAMRTSPQSTLRRSSLERKTRKLTPWLWLIFAALTAGGWLLLWIEELNLVFTFTGLFAVLVGFAFVTPQATTWLMGHLDRPLGWLLGAVGRMAPRDIARSLSRTSVAIAALMIAVSVIVAVSVMIGSFRGTVDRWLASTLQADVYLSPPALTASRAAGALAPDVVEAARSWPGVQKAVSAANVDVLAPDLGRTVELIPVDGDVSNGNRSYAWIDGSRATLWQRLQQGEGIIVSEPLVLREGLEMPPRPLSLLTAAGPRSFPVLAVFYDYASDQGAILIDRQLAERWWGPLPVNSMGLFVEPGADADQVTEALKARFSGREDVLVQSNLAVRGNALDIFDRTFAITAALQLLAIVVAFIGVLSALMSLQLERTRELGVLRATGMTVRQLWSMTLLETGLMGATAGLLAMPVGWVLAWIVIHIINRRSFGWTLEMNLDPSHFLSAFAVAVGAALLAGVYPALRLGRMVIAGAIREE
jgi:putative ABC transport system permease protein